MTGSTASSNFPTQSPLQVALGSASATNVFVAELNSTGNLLTYSTYLGGTGSDEAHGIAVDSTGNAYIAGKTNSANFPLMSGGTTGTNPFQDQLGTSAGNAFIAKLGAAAATGLTLFPSLYNFHDVGVGQNATEIVTLTNNTASGITISSFSFGGTNAGDFSLTAASPSPCSSTVLGFTLAAGSSCLLTIQFAPSDQDARSATFTVNSSTTMNLSGSGGAPQVSLNVTSVNFFPNPDPLNVPSTTSVTLTNTGGGPLLVGSAQIQGASPANAPISIPANESNCFSGPINPGGICTIDLLFLPTTSTVGSFTATLLINDNAAGSPQTLPITAASKQEVVVQPTSLELGTQVVNSTSTENANEAFLVNGSGEAINISVTAGTGADQGDFHVNNISLNGVSECSTVGSLQAGGSCALDVYFQPAAASGPDGRTGSYTIGWTGSSVPSVPGSQLVNVMGTGVSGISLSTNSLTAANEYVGFTDSFFGTEILYNGTSNPITVSVALTGNNPGDFTAPVDPNCAPGGVVPANTYCNVFATFSPSAIGLRTATATFTYTGVSNGQLVLSLSGTGIPGPVIITTNLFGFSDQVSAYDFGSEIMGTTTPEKVFQVHNIATVPLTVKVTPAPGNTDFKFGPDTTCPVPPASTAATVPGGGSCFIGVTFTPSTTTKETTTFVVTDSYSTTNGTDAGSPHTITLTGTGEAAAITISVSSGGSQLLDFGNVAINSISQAAIYLTNAGNSKTTISWPTPPNPTAAPNLLSAGPGFSLVASGTDLTTCTQGANVLPQGGNCLIGVQFDPTTSGEQTASVTFTDSVSGLTHTVNIQGNGAPQGKLQLTPLLTGTSTPGLTFEQISGTTSSPQTLTVTNTGSGPLTITNLSIYSFGSPSPFAITSGANSCSVGVAVPSGSSGNTCLIYVTFAPQATGSSFSPLIVQASLGNNASASVNADLEGTSVSGGFTLSPAGPINFGTVAVGSTVNSAYYSLTNENPTAVTFGALSVPAGYTIVSFLDSCSGQTIASLNSCSFEISITPSSAISYNGSLSIPFTGGSGTSPFTVLMQGSGSTAVIANPNPDSFQTFANSSASTTVTIANGSASQATITGVSAFTGSNPGNFSIPAFGDGCFSSGVGAVLTSSSGPCTISINFLSTVAGSFSAQFSVSYSISGTAQTPIVVTLNATIPASVVTVAPNPLIFPSQAVNTQSETMNVTLTNSPSSTQPLTVSSAQLAGNDFALFSTPNFTCFNIAPGLSCTIPIAFTPSQASVLNGRTGTLTITDNSTTSPHIVNLEGTGVAGSVSASPTTINFQPTNDGSTLTLAAIVSNTGPAVALGATTFTGPYSLGTGANACGSSLGAVTGTCALYITFTPSGSGTSGNSGTAVVHYGTSGTVTITLNGTALNPVVSVSPTSLIFTGLQLVGTESSQLPVTLTNGTASTITISSTPTASGDFLLGTNTCTNGAPVLAGGNCTVNVIFKPTATGTRIGTLQIADSPDTNSPHNVSLSGTGTTPATIAATSGATQSVVVNNAFATLQATVKDSGGNVLPGVSVVFVVTAAPGGATGTFAGGLTSATVTTDSNGIAAAPTLTANDVAGGPFTVAATAGAIGPANFSLTNSPGTPVSITATSGTPQSAAVGSAFAPLQATVLDKNSLPLEGVTVTFTAPASGPSGSFAAPGSGATATATTNASGVATAPTFTANSTAGGPYAVAATVGAVGPANFNLTNLAGAPSSVAATAGTPQSTAISTLFPTNLLATVKDSKGNLLSGVVVTFTAPSSGASGTFAAPGTGATATATTNASGVATAPAFTANSTVGAYTVNASVSGVTSPAAFSLTNLSGPPASIAATAGTPQSVGVNTAFTSTLQATVKDSGGNLVSGASVTFTAPASGASGTFAAPGSGATATVTTNASGVAISPIFTSNSTIGSYTVTAAVGGVSQQASFSLTNLAGPPASITATAGTPQSAVVTATFATLLQATVKDSGGNLVSGASVTFTAPASGASGKFANGTNTTTATTDTSGIATASAFTANTIAGGPYNVTASSGSATSASFSLTNTAGPAATITATSGTPQSATVTASFTTLLQATVKDANGNLVSGASVTFTAPGSGASGTFANTTNTTNATTNASGVATASAFTANTIAGGPYNVTATSGAATPANFSLTNTAGPAAAITATGGASQSVAINTAFASLQATVKDSHGNLVSGVTVTFTAPSSGASGTFAASGGNPAGFTTTAITNASGIATASTFTANTVAGGPYNVTATSGTATPANFSLTNTAGPAAAITATSGASQSVGINTAFASLQATVKDGGGNGVSGVSVTFTVTAAANGASGTFTGGGTTATVTTDVNGLATAPTFMANSTAGGPYTVAAKAGTIGPANFSLTNLSAPPASIAATAGTPQSVAISTLFPINLQATVEDKNSLPIAGVTVTFAAPSSGPSGTFAASGGNAAGASTTAVTNASGVASAPAFTANSIAGGPYNVQATAGNVSVNFVLTNQTGPAATITASSGATQSVVINSAFAPLAVTVTDSGGNLVNGATVTFTAPTSGPTGLFPGGVSTATVTTGANGVATATTFTSNSIAGGPYIVKATSGTATAASFNLTNLPGPPAILAPTGAASQSTAVNTAFGALQVTVKDASGNGVPNVSVTFTAPASGASGTFAAPGTGATAAVTTNSSGVATAPTFTANNTVGGPYNVAVTSGTLSTFDFSLTNLAGTPASIAATTGTPQSVAISSPFPINLQATVKDKNSLPLSGVIVTFTAPSSGPSGTFAGSGATGQATTDANGIATAAALTANAVAGGPYTVTATAGTIGPANFSLTNLAGAPASVAATAGTPQSVAISSVFTTNLQVTVKDSGGNLLSGVIVTFTAPASGASGTFAAPGTGATATATTNSSGVASAPAFTANSTVGAYTVNAAVGGVATAAAFSLTNLAGPPASVTATAGTPQSATINAAFLTALKATVVDSGGNPVSGVSVTFTASASGSSGTFGAPANSAIAAVVTNASGVAIAPGFTANSTAGPYTVTAKVTGVTAAASFSLTNLVGPPASITTTAGTPQSVPVTTAFLTALQATVKDSGGNLVSGASVTFTAPASGASGTFAAPGSGATATVTTNSTGVATAPIFTANATGGTYNVSASVAGVTANAVFALTNTVAPDVTISKSHSGDFVVGSSGVYTIKVTNNGTGPTTGTVTVTDVLPAGLTFASGTSTTLGWSCSASGQTVTCTNATVGLLAANGGNSTVTLNVSVGPNAITSSSASGFALSNTATVSDPNDSKTTDKSGPDPNATNIDNVVPSLSSFTPTLGLVAGATTDQTITLTGSGFNASTTVNFGTAVLTGGTASADGKTLTITVPHADLANAGSVIVTVTNPKNPTTSGGGGTSPANQNQTFPVVGITGAQDASTSGTIAVVAGTPATVKIDYTTNPANDSLPAALTVTCTVPQSLTGATCSVSNGTIAAGATSGSSTITINAIPGGAAAAESAPNPHGQGPLSPYLLWSVVAALLAGLAMTRKLQQRSLQFRRAPVYLALVLLVVGAGALVGCTTAAKPTPTPTGPSSITVTATTADGASVPTTVNIIVSN